MTVIKYPNDFTAHTAFWLRKRCPINFVTYCVHVRADLQKIIDSNIVFHARTISKLMHTLHLYHLYKYSLPERAINNECKIFNRF